jgi:hypothetical protein
LASPSARSSPEHHVPPSAGKNGDALRNDLIQEKWCRSTGKTVTLYVMTLSKHDLGKNGDALREKR